jgi:hypothetical protein
LWGISTLRILTLSLPSTSALDHHFLDPGDSFPRVQALGACPGAVENGVAPIEAERVFEIVEPFPRRLASSRLSTSQRQA